MTKPTAYEEFKGMDVQHTAIAKSCTAHNFFYQYRYGHWCLEISIAYLHVLTFLKLVLGLELDSLKKTVCLW